MENDDLDAARGIIYSIVASLLFIMGASNLVGAEMKEDSGWE